MPNFMIMKTIQPTIQTKTTLEDLADYISKINSKRVKVTKKQYIKNLLLTYRNLLRNNNNNSLILF